MNLIARSIILFFSIMNCCSCRTKDPPPRKSLNAINDYKDSMVVDSITRGLRAFGFFDANKQEITKEQFDSCLSTGEYDEAPFESVYNLKLIHLNKEELETRKKLQPLRFDLFKPGSILPNLRAADMKNEFINTNSLRGKIVVMNYWFLACGPCVREMKELNKIVVDYSNKGVIFLGITFDERKALERALPKLDFKYTIIPGQEDYIHKLKINEFPTHVILDKEGKVVVSFADSGPSTIYWLRKTIESCLQQ